MKKYFLHFVLSDHNFLCTIYDEEPVNLCFVHGNLRRTKHSRQLDTRSINWWWWLNRAMFSPLFLSLSLYIYIHIYTRNLHCCCCLEVIIYIYLYKICTHVVKFGSETKTALVSSLTRFPFSMDDPTCTPRAVTFCNCCRNLLQCISHRWFL